MTQGNGLDWDSDPALRALREEYRASFPKKSVELEEYLLTKNQEAVQSALHQLAGSLGSYGFPLLSEICGILDDRLDHEQVLASDTLATIQWVRELLLLLGKGQEEEKGWRSDPNWPRSSR
jgi:HPt (histidine-containing phosphotransfer) domain-containing protein